MYLNEPCQVTISVEGNSIPGILQGSFKHWTFTSEHPYILQRYSKGSASSFTMFGDAVPSFHHAICNECRSIIDNAIFEMVRPGNVIEYLNRFYQVERVDLGYFVFWDDGQLVQIPYEENNMWSFVPLQMHIIDDLGIRFIKKVSDHSEPYFTINGDPEEVKLYHLHELQNRYFQLKGKELEMQKWLFNAILNRLAPYKGIVDATVFNLPSAIVPTIEERSILCKHGWFVKSEEKVDDRRVKLVFQ